MRKSIKNNLYMLKITFSASPVCVLINIFTEIIRSSYNVFFGLLFTRMLFNSLSNGTSLRTAIITLAVFIAGEGFFRLLFALSENYLYPVMFAKIRNHIMTMVFNKVNCLELACFEDTEFYNNYTVSVSEANSKAREILDSISEFIGQIASLATMLGFIALISFPAVLISIIPMTIVLVLNVRKNKLDYQKYLDNVEPNRKYGYISRILFLREYAGDIRTTDISNAIFKRLGAAEQELLQNIEKYGRKLGILVAAWNIFANILPSFLAYSYAVYLYFVKHSVGVGDFLSLVSAITAFEWAIFNVSRHISNIQNNGMYIQKFRDFMDYKPKLFEYQTGYNPLSFHSLEIDGIDFTYPDGTKAISGLNLTIKKGEHIAIVGYNGSGKSTLVKLLLRLYDPDRGRIRYNGCDIREYDLQKYRSLFGTVFQDYQLFAQSIAENVLMKEYNPDVDGGILWEALNQGGIAEKVATLPAREDSQLTKEFDDNGIMLSGGEFQKLAISRAFAKNFEIGIFDEPTAALDPVSEHEFFQRLYKLSEGKTVLFISHRLSSTLLADRIIVMEGGSIVEQGTHAELMDLNGKYAAMFMAQAENYTKKGASDND